MSDTMRIVLNGEVLVLDCAGALYWPSERTLIVSDVHLEKGSSLARRGVLLPPYDTRVSLRRLAHLLAQYQPLRVISLGDSFHDAEGADRLCAEERADLSAFVCAVEWVWIEGNHDPQTPAWLGGIAATEIAIGGLVFRHEPSAAGICGEIAGHLHPCTTVTRRGRSVRRRCFITDGLRLVMPAFGAYAGGLDIGDKAFAGLFQQSYLAYALGAERVYAVAGDLRASSRVTANELTGTAGLVLTTDAA